MDAEKRNVTAIRLRGEKSEGLVLPLETLSAYTDITKLKDGDQITILGGHEICRKYIPHGNRRSSGNVSFIVYSLYGSGNGIQALISQSILPQYQYPSSG